LRFLYSILTGDVSRRGQQLVDSDFPALRTASSSLIGDEQTAPCQSYGRQRMRVGPDHTSNAGWVSALKEKRAEV